MVYPVSPRCLEKDVPAEAGAFDADRILADALERLEVAENGTRAIRVELDLGLPIQGHHLAEVFGEVVYLLEDLPMTASLIIDAEDWLMEHPWLRIATASTMPSPTFSSNSTSSPQRGLTPSASASGWSSEP